MYIISRESCLSFLHHRYRQNQQVVGFQGFYYYFYTFIQLNCKYKNHPVVVSQNNQVCFALICNVSPSGSRGYNQAYHQLNGFSLGYYGKVQRSKCERKPLFFQAGQNLFL